MDDARKAKRIALGIPVHESEEEHAYDMHSGYCQCGEFNPKWNKSDGRYARSGADGTVRSVSLDDYEGGENGPRKYIP